MDPWPGLRPRTGPAGCGLATGAGKVTKVTGMKQAGASAVLPSSPGGAPQGVELRHLRYFVAVADAGTFTHAAEHMYIAQPTLSQQIRRLEEMVGTPLLQRRREGMRLTEAGSVLLEESRGVLSRVDHGVPRCERASCGRPWHHLGQPDENHLCKEHPQCLRSRFTA